MTRPGHDEESRGPTPPDPPTGKQASVEQLRGANEQLIVGAMRAQGLADDAEATRDVFLAMVSHELRNPLNAILGWARLLATGQLDPRRTAGAIQTIERNAMALGRLIDDLLDSSRIIGGNLPVAAHPLDLVAVIHAALDEVRPTAQAKTLDLAFACPVVPDPVAGDAIRLQQVVANLLSNAIKFTPPGGRIAVTLTAAGPRAEIRVADTGQGIAPEFLPHIFDRFTQADPTTTRRQGGLGLGLAIVRALVERHGGTVQADSPGRNLGATFTVRLPVLAARDADDAGRAIRDTTTAAAGPARIDGVRVLLVEDNDDGRDVLRIILELAGAKVTSARSVREALVLLDANPPDVIVSDIGMPDEDGYALIRSVRAREGGERGRGIPAVALTGYVLPADEARLLAAGFQRHVGKPVDPDAIVAAVASLAATGES